MGLAPRRERLSLAQARRIALAAQGFGRPSPREVTGARLVTLVRRTGVLQIDSVNVLARAHLMPPYSRLGPWEPALLARASSRGPRRLVEAWAHQASFIPVEHYPLFSWRRAEHERNEWVSAVHRRHPGVVADVAALVRERGPITARELQVEFEAEHPRRTGQWGWNWSVAKRAVEYLFYTGQVAIAGRNSQFERRYDIPERVLPAAVMAAASPSRPEAIAQLVAISLRAHGIGTVGCVADYYRLTRRETMTALDELVEAGTARRVAVDGWSDALYLDEAARVPRRVAATSLISPFDPLVFERARTEALFAMRYRIGIYTPASKRTDGYYALPFLHDERLAARVDLKAERTSGALRVVGAWPGTEVRAGDDEALRTELRRLADWLALNDIEVAPGAPGDLAPALR